jgi:glucosamine--fructose-6-phosphate aminotransferase (isomerizing)
MTHLYNEINEQPDAIERLLTDERHAVKQIAATIREFNPQFVMIAARGTSDNAARYAQYALSIRAGLPVALATPSVHTLYDANPVLQNALVIGISQSGQSADVRRVLSDAREQGALTLSITNDPASPLAESTAHHIYLHAGDEISVAATKTCTTELTALAMLVQALVDDDFSPLKQLPAQVSTTLQQSADIQDWIARYRYADRLAVIGRGYNYCTAFEISLKIKELCYIVSEEYSEADFRHGPIAIIERGFPVVVIAPSGRTQPQMRDLLDELHAQQAECLVISDVPERLSQGIHGMALPQGLPEWLSPVCAVIPGQIFALHLATVRGVDVDQPRYLNKVTSTE